MPLRIRVPRLLARITRLRPYTTNSLIIKGYILDHQLQSLIKKTYKHDHSTSIGIIKSIPIIQRAHTLIYELKQHTHSSATLIRITRSLEHSCQSLINQIVRRRQYISSSIIKDQIVVTTCDTSIYQKVYVYTSSSCRIEAADAATMFGEIFDAAIWESGF